MITTQELAKRFEKFFINSQKKDETSAEEFDIKIPYKNLAKIWGGFETGNCYTFFGKECNNALDVFRINLLWQLARNNTPVHILEGGDLFERDFESLVMLQSKVSTYKLKTKFITREQSKDVLEGIKVASTLPIAWHTDVLPDAEELWRGEGFKYPATLPLVCAMNLSLEDWHLRAEFLWDKAQNRNRILLLFVQLPRSSEGPYSPEEPFDFYDVYLPDLIILPENLCSHMGYIRPHYRGGMYILHTKETESLINRECYFDRQSIESPLEEKEL